ncbi:MAG: abortive phage resistance protein [Cytophagales bacterium]|nr:MAG: abortive phage resistance protein [Cytophagales bacterium]
MNNLHHEELNTFYKNNQQDVIALVENEEEGSSLESKFTELMTDMLVEAGETANISICTEIREDKAGRRMHKINAYALSESYETVDLFITIHRNTENFENITKEEVTTASNLAKRFLNDAMKGTLREVEESAKAFDLIQILDKYSQDIIRVNIFIIADGVTNADTPKETEIDFKNNNHAVLVIFHLWDLERFYQLYFSKNKREAIQIDFQDDFGGAVPCLSMPSENEDYESYLAIISGETLAGIYRNFGSRLLEQNIRSFLQFTGKINKGIRDTIKKEPQMFLAFNNGIAGTAEEVELIDLPNGGKGIANAKDFQIVNGGQTTASIFHSQKQDKSDLSKIFVQLKLTVVKKKDEFALIVSRIAEYANSQNKVSVADLSSNHPFHIEFEKLSRIIWAPDPTNQNRQTRWFYERARGQYKNEINKEGSTPARKKAFEIKNPRNQVLQKEDLAKFSNAWNLIPYFVARGRQKCYVEFFKNLKNIRKNELPDNVFFEDLVAQAILFRTAEKEYGVGDKAIGDLRFLVVPYTLSYLNQATDKKIDLYKIWKAQGISENLRIIIRNLLEKIDASLRTTTAQEAGGMGLISEWGKKEKCWEVISKIDMKISFSTIEDDFIPKQGQSRYKKTEDEIAKLERQAHIEELKNVPQQLWKKIAEWGKVSGKLSQYKISILENVAKKLKDKKELEDLQLKNGLDIFELAFRDAPQLFLDITDEASTQEKVFDIEITTQLIEELFDWGKKRYNLSDQEFNFIKKIKNQALEPSEFQKNYIKNIVRNAQNKGFMPRK